MLSLSSLSKPEKRSRPGTSCLAVGLRTACQLPSKNASIVRETARNTLNRWEKEAPWPFDALPWARRRRQTVSLSCALKIDWAFYCDWYCFVGACAVIVFLLLLWYHLLGSNDWLLLINRYTAASVWDYHENLISRHRPCAMMTDWIRRPAKPQPRTAYCCLSTNVDIKEGLVKLIPVRYSLLFKADWLNL